MPTSKKVLLDTNFLMIPGEIGVDIFNELERVCQFEYQVYILDKTVKELEKIVEKQKGKYKEAAKLGLSLIKAKNIEIIPTEGDQYVDDILVELQNEYIIATQDKALKTKLKNIIILRQKKYLELIEA